VVNHRPTLAGGVAVAALVLFAALAHASGAPRKASWREEDNCRELTFKGVSTQHYDLGQQIVSGRLTHTGRDPVRNVKVCGNGVCTVIDEGGEMKEGESAEFELNIPSLNAVILAVACSALHPD
jgi:hypothetical protein